MGLYDAIDVLDVRGGADTIRCSCGLEVASYQTKSLDSTMERYLLTGNADDWSADPRLYLLELDESLWHEFTPEEIVGKNIERAQRRSEFPDSAWLHHLHPELEKGDGEYPKDAHDAANMKKRYMGDWPHQYVEMHTSCPDCRRWISVDLKFTDGRLVQQTVKCKELS